jgi:hypothetical protein
MKANEKQTIVGRKGRRRGRTGTLIVPITIVRIRRGGSAGTLIVHAIVHVRDVTQARLQLATIFLMNLYDTNSSKTTNNMRAT